MKLDDLVPPYASGCYFLKMRGVSFFFSNEIRKKRGLVHNLLSILGIGNDMDE